jgi:hypothetical protein
MRRSFSVISGAFALRNHAKAGLAHGKQLKNENLVVCLLPAR